MKAINLYLTLFILLVSSEVIAQSFTAGNIVVCRVGNGGAAMSTGGTMYPVFLDEYTPSGVKVQTISIPSVNGSSNALVTGPDLYWGYLTLSADKQYLALTGYNASAGSVVSSASDASSVPRTIALIKYDGSINIATSLTDFSSRGYPTTAITSNGTDIWLCSNAGGTDGSTGVSTGGVRYTSVGATTSVQLATTTPNGFASLQIANGQLYCSGLGVTSGNTLIGSVGYQLPITSGQGIANLPGMTAIRNYYQFIFFDENPSIDGPDVLYAAMNTGVQKYSLNSSGTWKSNGIITTGGFNTAIGLTGSISNGVVTLFVTVAGSNASSSIRGGQIVTLTDATGYTTTSNTFTGTPSVLVDLFVNNPTAFPVNSYSFKGITLVPQAGAVPVLLRDITANRLKNDIKLSWRSITEVNTSRFDIERSFNTIDFVKTGTITAKGSNNNYSFTDVDIVDKASNHTVIYYRLKMVDKDGKFTFSKIVAVKLNDNTIELVSAYPNPFEDAVNVKVNMSSAGHANLNLMDGTGRAVRSLELNLAAGSNTISIPNLQFLDRGVYLLKADVNGTVSTIKLVK